MHTTIMFEDNAKVMQQRRFHDFYYSIIIKKKKGMRLRQLKGEPNQNILQSHKKENIPCSN